MGVQKKRKNRKTWKSKSEEEVMGFSSVCLFPVRIREAATQGGTRGIDKTKQRKTLGAQIVKGKEDKRDHGRILDIFT